MVNDFPNSEAWYSFDDMLRIRGVSVRTARHDAAQLSPTLMREQSRTGRGRPSRLYHYTAFPELSADYAVQHEVPLAPVPEEGDGLQEEEPSRPVSPEDAAIAVLRLRAVKEFTARTRHMPKKQAAALTCRDWTRKPPTMSVPVDERLPGGHSRKTRKTIELADFKPRTLRRWSSLYKETKKLLDLAPARKGQAGRKRKDIDPDLLDFVQGVAGCTARADVTKAVEYAREHWSGEMPDLSIETWQRRIRERDPRKMFKDLNHSVSKFRARQSPDVEIDWTQLGYNDEWQIDDVQEDWYAHASEAERIIRPHAYAIMRSSTRQWIAFVATETDIVQEQVRTLVATAMVSSQGGMPGLIKFELGTVAVDPQLKDILETLEVKVSRTSRDDGQVTPDVLPDRIKGHPQGKALIERGMQAHHELQWDALGQVGPAERTTAPGRTETLKAEAKRRAKDGEFLILPSPEQWHARIKATMEKHNNKPHGGLPEIIDAETGKRRHMTPNEKARYFKDSEIRIMDQELLPLFYAKGEHVDVTRNGIRLRSRSYGRFDEDLLKLKKVTAYVQEDCPELAYVAQLGRCVELYEKARPGDSEQFAKKRHLEKRFRNNFEKTVAQAMKATGQTLIQSVQVTVNPVPERPHTTVSHDQLLSRAQGLQRGIDRHRERKADLDRRLEFGESQGTRPSRSRRKSNVLVAADKGSPLLDVIGNPTEE